MQWNLALSTVPDDIIKAKEGRSYEYHWQYIREESLSNQVDSNDKTKTYAEMPHKHAMQTDNSVFLH